MAMSADKVKSILDSNPNITKEERKEIEKINSDINFLIKSAVLYK